MPSEKGVAFRVTTFCVDGPEPRLRHYEAQTKPDDGDVPDETTVDAAGEKARSVGVDSSGPGGSP